MAGHPRWIALDDIDSSIQYDGPWVAFSQSFSNLGNFGPTFESTLHGTNGTAGLSFSFTGSSLRVLGTNNLLNSSGVLDPTWDCLIDGKSIGPTAPFQFPENNWVFCEWDGADGSHVATVNATSKGQTFWIDQIQYLPSASTSTSHPLVLLDHLDNAINYDSSWQALGDSANMTSKAGSTMTLEFTGAQLSWWGFIPTELSHSPSSAAYAIDGAAPVAFTLTGLPPDKNAGTVYNQMFFETPLLLSGQHQLTVIYRGNGTPLTITNLLIQDGNVTVPSISKSGSTPTSTIPVVAASNVPITTSSTSNIKSSESTNGSSQTPIGGILGGVLGGLALFCVIIFIILYWFKYRKQQNMSYNGVNRVQPFTFPAPPSNGPEMQQYGYNQQAAVPAQNHHHRGLNQNVPEATHSSFPSLTNTDQLTYDPPSTRSNGGSSHRGRGTGVATERRVVGQNVPVNNITPFTFEPVRKERLAMEDSRSTSGVSRAVSPESQSTRSRVLLHEDSGVRLGSNQQVPVTLVEVPPIYSAG